MKMKRIAIVILPLAFTVALASLGAAQTFQSALDLELGGRPAGLAGAFTGLADDENALFFNPAGLASLEQTQLSSFYESRFGVASLGSFLVAGSRWGLGLLFLGVGGLEGRDELDQPTETYSYGSFSLLAGVASSLQDLPLPIARGQLPGNPLLGARFKLHRINTLADGSGLGAAFDWAFLLRFPNLRAGPAQFDLGVGLLLENLPGFGIAYGSGYAESWPMGIRFGLAIGFLQRLTVLADFSSQDLLHVGAEFNIAAAMGELALRLGYFTRGGVTVGLGFSLRDLQVHYALIAQPLALSHRLGVAFRFNLADLLRGRIFS